MFRGHACSPGSDLCPRTPRGLGNLFAKDRAAEVWSPVSGILSLSRKPRGQQMRRIDGSRVSFDPASCSVLGRESNRQKQAANPPRAIRTQKSLIAKTRFRRSRRGADSARQQNSAVADYCAPKPTKGWLGQRCARLRLTGTSHGGVLSSLALWYMSKSWTNRRLKPCTRGSYTDVYLCADHAIQARVRTGAYACV